MSEREALFERAEEVLGLFHRGAEFTRELLKENERLRARIAGLEESHCAAARDPHDWEKLRGELLERIHDLEEERQQFQGHLQTVEEENRQFAVRFVEVEEENNALANLYVASYQLHSTLDLGEVLKVIIEIVINLVGAECFAVYVLDNRSDELVPVAFEGHGAQNLPRLKVGEGRIGGAVLSGEVSLAEPGGGSAEPLACIPLRVDDGPIGAIAIYGLLEQKSEFTPLDRELFTLLAGHAAAAIFASQLHGQSQRKLDTIRGFIDLLTN